MTKKTELPVRVRSINDNDIGFVFNAWLKSYRDSKFAKHIPSMMYFTSHHKVIEKLLLKANTLLVCNDDDPTQIYGFLNYEIVDGIFVIHYVYVKHSFRKFGLASMLLDTAGYKKDVAALYTHINDTSVKLGFKKNILFNPYLIFDLGINTKEEDKK
jgi:GNAT superfamily N-acetyltransferase